MPRLRRFLLMVLALAGALLMVVAAFASGQACDGEALVNLWHEAFGARPEEWTGLDEWDG